MRILHINSYYYGGIFYKYLYEEQKKLNMDFDVYVPIAANQDDNKVDYGEYSRLSQVYGKLDRLLYFPKHIKMLRDVQKYYDVQKYDAVHAHSLFSNGYIAYNLWKKYKIPYVVAVRNTDINMFFKYMFFLRNVGVDILLNASKVIFISKPYMDMHIDKYIPQKYLKQIKDKSIVLPNGINRFWLENIRENASGKNFEDKKINILSVGEVSSNKNQITTLKACKMLIKKGYYITFNIVGKIVDQNVFNELLKEPFVKYHGVKEKEELIHDYRGNDIFVMPSIFETFGLSYAEAMSQGLPVIYSKGQGFDGQFEEGTIGYAVDSKSPEDIAEKIELVLKNYNTIRKRCVEEVYKYDWAVIAKEYEEIYDSALTGN